MQSREKTVSAEVVCPIRVGGGTQNSILDEFDWNPCRSAPWKMDGGRDGAKKSGVRASTRRTIPERQRTRKVPIWHQQD